MSKPSKSSRLAWVLIPLCALGFLVWQNSLRIEQVLRVSALGGWSDHATTAPGSADTGAPHNGLIVPGHNNDSYHWLIQTQQMFARKEWRVRHIDYENAPLGRDVTAPSPYRWWLGLIAASDHVLSGRPLSASVERAALIADPLLHLLLLLVTTVFVWRRFGAMAAVLLSAGLTFFFPLGAEFVPGAPDDLNLVNVCLVWMVLPVLVGLRAASNAPATNGTESSLAKSRRTPARPRFWFWLSGVFGGVGLWLSVSHAAPILFGIALGALAAAWISRSETSNLSDGSRVSSLWREWALAGAVTSLAGYLLEFAPAQLGMWQLRAIHPLYGLAWLGAGELLARTTAWLQGSRSRLRAVDVIVILLALAAVAALPVVLWKTKSWGFLTTDLSAFRLGKLSTESVAGSLFDWWQLAGPNAKVWAVLLPTILVGPAVWLICTRKIPASVRGVSAIALAPVLVAIGFACRQLSWWTTVDALLLVLLVGVSWGIQYLPKPRAWNYGWAAFVGLLLLPGLLQTLPRDRGVGNNVLDEADVLSLIERDMANWLATHAGEPNSVVLAPPNETTTLYYFGGLRGLGTLSWENKDGLGVAVRLLSASTPEEAKELGEKRGVRYIVMPSWDAFLDEYAKMGMGQLEGTFLERLHAWKLAPWLRPVAYQLPQISGFEGQSVTILQFVEDQDDAPAFSRIAEYFLEIGQLDNAASAAQSLRRFPFDLGALVARAQVEIARADTAASTRTLATLKSRVTGGADRTLPWDRRVSLAAVLAQAKQMDLARDRVRRCVEEATEPRLRSLTPGALYRLMVLAHAFKFEFKDPQLHAFALSLLPKDVREQLERRGQPDQS